MSEEKIDSEESKLDSDDVEENSELSLINPSQNNETDIRVYFFVLAYVIILIILSLIFESSIVAFILWIMIGFGIYKAVEKYGEDMPWFSEVLEKIQNFGFSIKKENDSDEDRTEIEEEIEKEQPVNPENYAEKFDEWRVTKDTVSAPFVSAGDKISRFSFNSDGMYKVRLWLFLILVPLFIWIFVWGFVTWPFFYWYQIIGFSEVDADIFSAISGLFLSYFLIIRFYSHCTNNRTLPINSDILSDYDNYAVTHLFRFPNTLDNYTLTMKALLLNFIVGWLMLWVPLLSFFFGVKSEPILSILTSFVESDAFPLLKTLLYVAVAVPIIEELLFRGFVLDLASESYGSWPSIFISSVIFGIVHLNPASVLNAFFLGMIYGYLRIRTNSLWPSIFLHSIWNAHIEILIFVGYW